MQPGLINTLITGQKHGEEIINISEKINLLAENRQLRTNLGRSARKTIISTYSLERISEKYIELYNGFN